MNATARIIATYGLALVTDGATQMLVNIDLPFPVALGIVVLVDKAFARWAHESPPEDPR